MYNSANGYQQTAGGPAASNRPRKEKINQWEGTGIVQARGRNQEIRFIQFAQGGGAVHINLSCAEFTGQADQYGNPKSTTTYVPVDVYTNKNITAQQLQGIIPGMKVRVVGRLATESYDGRDGQRRTTIVVRAFVFEILAMPMQSPQPSSYGGNPAQYQQGPYVQPTSGQQGYYPQGQPAGYPQPQNPNPQTTAQQPQYRQQPQYGHQPQYGQQQPVPGYTAPASGPYDPGMGDDLPIA